MPDLMGLWLGRAWSDEIQRPGSETLNKEGNEKGGFRQSFLVRKTTVVDAVPHNPNF